MSRPIRIGLIAEGEAELGTSVPYIKPEDGGRIIERNREGALHTLIRRELQSAGFSDCYFVHRHPSIGERGIKLRTGHSILNPKYLAQVVIAWKPEEVDMILIVVDADDLLPQRKNDLVRALDKIRENHLDINNQPIHDRSAGGLAIKNLEAWLLADVKTVAKILSVKIQEISDIENSSDTKEKLDAAINESTYLVEQNSNQRPLQIRWKLALNIDLTVIKTCCPTGYAAFAKELVTIAEVTTKFIEIQG